VAGRCELASREAPAANSGTSSNSEVMARLRLRGSTDIAHAAVDGWGLTPRGGSGWQPVTRLSPTLPHAALPLLPDRYPARPVVNPGHDRTGQASNQWIQWVENAASKAASEGVKDSSRTNTSACGAPISRSIPASSHSTERGPS